jgi:hypothetical protein
MVGESDEEIGEVFEMFTPGVTREKAELEEEIREIKEIFTPYSTYTDKAKREKTVAQSKMLLAKVNSREGRNDICDDFKSNSNIVMMNDEMIMQVATSDFVFTVDEPISKLLCAIRKDVLPCDGDWSRYGSEDVVRSKYVEEYPCGDDIDDSPSDDGERFSREAGEICSKIDQRKTGYFLWPVSYVLKDKALSAHEIDFMVNVMDKNISFFKEFLIHGPTYYDGRPCTSETIELRPFEVLFSYDSETERSTFGGGFGFFEIVGEEEDEEDDMQFLQVYMMQTVQAPLSTKKSIVKMYDVPVSVVLRVGASNVRDQNWQRRGFLAMMRNRAFVQLPLQHDGGRPGKRVIN